MKLVKSVESHVFFFFKEASETIAMFSLFISTTGKRVFQTGRALAVIIAHQFCSLCCTVCNRNLPHFGRLYTYSFALIPS